MTVSQNLYWNARVITRIGRTARRPLILLSMALAFATVQAAPTGSEGPVTITAEQHYYLALEAQSARDFPEMMRALRLASEGGNLHAQETLAMALLVGERFYGKSVKFNLCEAQMWARRAAAQESEVAKFQAIFLNRLAQARLAADHCAAWDRAMHKRP